MQNTNPEQRKKHKQEYSAKYYQENKDKHTYSKIKDSIKRYQEKNRDKLRQYARERYQRNKVVEAQKRKQWKHDNHALVLESKRLYREKLKTNRPCLRRFMLLKLSAKKRNLPFNLEKGPFIAWLETTPHRCVYCGLQLHITTQLYSKTVLTIDRKDNNIGYQMDNICVSCISCNRIKSNILSFDDMILVAKQITTAVPTYNK